MGECVAVTIDGCSGVGGWVTEWVGGWVSE